MTELHRTLTHVVRRQPRSDKLLAKLLVVLICFLTIAIVLMRLEIVKQTSHIIFIMSLEIHAASVLRAASIC